MVLTSYALLLDLPAEACHAQQMPHRAATEAPSRPAPQRRSVPAAWFGVISLSVWLPDAGQLPVSGACLFSSTAAPGAEAEGLPPAAAPAAVLEVQAFDLIQLRGQGMRSRHVRTAELQLSMPPNRPGGFCHLAQNIGA